jgi:DNA repair exonuclease SbcCD ATPase subunit
MRPLNQPLLAGQGKQWRRGIHKGAKYIELQKIESKLESTNSLIKSTREKIGMVKEQKATFEKSRAERIEKLQTQVNDVEKQIEVLKGQTPFKKLPKAIRKLAGTIESLQSKVDINAESREFDLFLRKNTAQTELEKLEVKLTRQKELMYNAPKECDKCGAPIPKEKVLAFKKASKKICDTIEQELTKQKAFCDELSKKHEELKTKVKRNVILKEKIFRLDKKLKNLYKKELENKNLEDKIKVLYATNFQRKEQIESIQAEKPPKTEIRKFRHNLGELKKAKKLLLIDYKVFKGSAEVDKWLINDPLGNSGLKAFIFDSMMGRVNKYLSTYKNLVGFDIKVKVDLESARKDINIYITKEDDEVPYEDLSGGEQQLADVVIAFSLNDVVYESKPMNILLLDELFESLDTDNIEKVEGIVNQKSKTRCVFLITHQSSFTPTGAKVITIKKSEGLTAIQDY